MSYNSDVHVAAKPTVIKSKETDLIFTFLSMTLIHLFIYGVVCMIWYLLFYTFRQNDDVMIVQVYFQECRERGRIMMFRRNVKEI